MFILLAIEKKNPLKLLMYCLHYSSSAYAKVPIGLKFKNKNAKTNLLPDSCLFKPKAVNSFGYLMWK